MRLLASEMKEGVKKKSCILSFALISVFLAFSRLLLLKQTKNAPPRTELLEGTMRTYSGS
jgi:hypothetical protein